MHIDVRGPHPILFDGMRCWILEGAPKGITVEEAIEWVKRTTGEEIKAK